MRILLLIGFAVAILNCAYGKTVKKQLQNVETQLERPPLFVQEFKGLDMAQQLPKRPNGIDDVISVRQIEGNGLLGADTKLSRREQIASSNTNTKNTSDTNEDNSVDGLSVSDDIDLDNCFPRICHRMYLPVCANIDGEMVTAASPCEFNNRVICAKMARTVGKRAPTIRFLHRGPCV